MCEGRATVNARASTGGDAMPDPLCRLSIQHGPHTVDLALPNEAPVGLLLPSIVDLVQRGGVAIDEGRQWHLSRVGQERLDAAVSLHDNAIRDGELLLLTDHAHSRASMDPRRSVPRGGRRRRHSLHADAGGRNSGVRVHCRVRRGGACLVRHRHPCDQSRDDRGRHCDSHCDRSGRRATRPP